MNWHKSQIEELISSIPAQWDGNLLKRGYEITLGKMLQGDQKQVNDVYAPYLRSANVQWGNVDVTDVRQMWFTKEEASQLCLETGDLVVCEGGDAGRAAIWRGAVESCCFQNSVNRVRSSGGNSTGFLMYWLAMLKASGYVEIICNKATIAHLTKEKLGNLPMVFPPTSEQHAIASYLDAETARIDGLIADKEALIETLKEMRRSTVAEAITRGVRGDRPMRRSGLSWVDEIPTEWKTLSLKRFVRLSGGHTPSTGNPAYWDGSVPWFSPKDMKADELQDSIDHVTELAVSESGLQVIEPGTTMIVVRGMILAHTFPVCVAQVKATINQDMKALVPDERVDKRFLPWLLRGASALFLSLTEQSAHGTMALRTERFMGEKLPIPPLDEQMEIVEHLEAERQRIDLLLRQINQEIDLLRELRLATITDAVLGRIDVREHMKH